MEERRQADPAIADMTGSSALPRRSGELVFHERWERRAFALAVALSEAGRYDWEDFRQNLISAIEVGQPEAEASDRRTRGYYEKWLTALERTLFDNGIIIATQNSVS